MDMVKRVEGLENDMRAVRDRLISLETRSESFSTKADVANAKNSIILWVVGAFFITQLIPTVLKHLGI
jgi:hypothetical protein